MDYFFSHIGTLIVAALLIAGVVIATVAIANSNAKTKKAIEDGCDFMCAGCPSSQSCDKKPKE